MCCRGHFSVGILLCFLGQSPRKGCRLFLLSFDNFAQVAYHHPELVWFPAQNQLARRNKRRHLGAVGCSQQQFAVVFAPRMQAQQLVQEGLVLRRDPVGNDRADHLFKRCVEHAGNTAIRIQDQSLGTGDQRTLLHRLDENPVSVVGTLEREETFASVHRDDQRVNPSAADGVQFLLGLGQSCAQLPVLGQALCFAGVLSDHVVFLGRSRPASTRSASDRSPTTRRAGKGSVLIRAGTAVICSSFAKWGCW